MRTGVLAFADDVRPDARAELERSLAELSCLAAEPACLPFAGIRTLHFGSIVLFDTPGFSPLLVMECNFDGSFDALVRDLLNAFGEWLPRLFGCCLHFPGVGPTRRQLEAYMRQRAVWPAVVHVGNVGRGVARIRQEADLRDCLSARIDHCLTHGPRPADPAAAFALIDRERRNGPWAWIDERHETRSLAERIAPWAELLLWGFGALALALAFAPVTVPLLAVAVFMLRRDELRDAGPPPVADQDHARRLADHEDLGSQNHLANLTIVKPGRLRRMVLRLVLRVSGLLARTATGGTLRGVASIHFAQWSLIDHGRRLLFLSNFDGSWESYLDDFIERASPGLTAIWSNTEGFPPARFLFSGGARDAAAFKAFSRGHQAAAAVRYAAYPDLTVRQIDTNTALRDGLASPPTGAALLEWLRRW